MSRQSPVPGLRPVCPHTCLRAHMRARSLYQSTPLIQKKCGETTGGADGRAPVARVVSWADQPVHLAHHACVGGKAGDVALSAMGRVAPRSSCSTKQQPPRPIRKRPFGLGRSGPLKRLRKIPYWLHRPESPEITGGSVEFSTRSNPPKSENDAFVVLGGLQPKGSPL